LINTLIGKVFGTKNERVVKSMMPQVTAINVLEPQMQKLTDAELRAYIRQNLATLYHPVGSCAMGGDSRLAASRLTSVVDPELRVRGVAGLRVVDASVMPAVPRGNTNAPVIAIAERAADLIGGRA